ncbi:aminoglycoside phosphotransferase family protein [Salipiger bermudensis]|uniref:phosphotransferase n=1 Tax=Salipiger bermudensis TaxID=344736 RepID=UPI001C99ADC6|nr:phosphotransferase [Salipiger bermudensis]MBY6003993.1 aminoglycoside phosphotransferase family protein [Salipiger bermudensis]
MEMRGGDLEAAALALWPDLAGEMGEDPGLWQAAPLAWREDARVARVLLRLTGPEGRRLVLKHQARPVVPETFAEAIATHMAVQEVWPEGLPLMRAVDLARQACVMDHLEARPLSVLLEDAPLARQAELLRRAGAWLDGFHRALPGETRVFQPKFTVRFLRSVIDDLRAGERDVAEPARFLDCAEALCAMQPRFEGQETMSAQTHGDLHQRNLVLDDSRCWGVDFAGGRVVPVGHDIARLLTDYAILHAPKEAIPEGEVLPPEAQAAFFEGYRIVGPGDPSVQLLLRNRVLAEWWGLPARAAARSRAQARRFTRLMALAERVFAGHA